MEAKTQVVRIRRKPRGLQRIELRHERTVCRILRAPNRLDEHALTVRQCKLLGVLERERGDARGLWWGAVNAGVVLVAAYIRARAVLGARRGGCREKRYGNDAEQRWPTHVR